MHQQVVELLQRILSTPWIDVVFLIDDEGQLLSSVGSSEAFSATGGFQYAQPEPAHYQPQTSLYMHALSDKIYLGVVFAADIEIDQVREEVRPHLPRFDPFLK